MKNWNEVDWNSHWYFLEKENKLVQESKWALTPTETDAGVFPFSPNGIPYYYGSTSIGKITDNFFNLN